MDIDLQLKINSLIEEEKKKVNLPQDEFCDLLNGDEGYVKITCLNWPMKNGNFMRYYHEADYQKIRFITFTEVPISFLSDKVY